MDLFALMRMLGALLLVLGLMAVGLWAVRRYNLRLPGRIGGHQPGRIELVERTALDARRSVALLRRDGREHLILIAPEGNLVIESTILRDEIDHAAEAERLRIAEEKRAAAAAAMAQTKAELAQMRDSFAQMVDGARDRLAERTAPAFTLAGDAIDSVSTLAGLVLHGPDLPVADDAAAKAEEPVVAPPAPAAPLTVVQMTPTAPRRVRRRSLAKAA
jgi:flagellar biogenesis protein FliO